MDLSRAALEAELRGHVKHGTRLIASLVFCFGVNVGLAAYNIVTPGQSLAFQTVVVVMNVGAAVYGWHVVMRLAAIRAHWLDLIGRLQ